MRAVSGIDTILFLSTPSARRATEERGEFAVLVAISIHALREEGDLYQRSRPCCCRISIHALREEGDAAPAAAAIENGKFLSTPSARRATYYVQQREDTHNDFYPRPPRGGRRRPSAGVSLATRFLSTPSARRATRCGVPRRWGISISIHALREEGDARATVRHCWVAYFYPRPPRGGRLPEPILPSKGAAISIHALREEGDSAWCAGAAARRNFYPRPPRGGRPLWLSSGKAQKRFLSTPSARRATLVQAPQEADHEYFYPRPPRGGRRCSAVVSPPPKRDFYPRPPRGGRPDDSFAKLKEYIFLSTPSVSMNFYPRPPRGGRPSTIPRSTGRRRFLSTPSARRATEMLCKGILGKAISIHALREEGDRRTVMMDMGIEISIHALREEGDSNGAPSLWPPARFLSTPSARRATGNRPRHTAGHSDFYPRPPRGGRQQKQRQNLYFQTNYTTFCTNLEEP